MLHDSQRGAAFYTRCFIDIGLDVARHCASLAKPTPASVTCFKSCSRERRRIPANAARLRIAPAGWPSLLKRILGVLVTTDASVVSLQVRGNGNAKLIPQLPRLPDPLRERAGFELTLAHSQRLVSGCHGQLWRAVALASRHARVGNLCNGGG